MSSLFSFFCALKRAVCTRYERQSFVSSSRMLKYLESKALAKAMLHEEAEKEPDPEEDVRSFLLKAG